MWNFECTPRKQYGSRRGTSTVEFAMIAIPLFILTFGSIEIGRALMVIQSLEDAARIGCRMAILDDAEISEIENEIGDYLSAADITDYEPKIDPDPLTDACLWDPVTVRISVPYNSVTWIPVPMSLADVNLSGSCVLPREGNPCDD